MLEGELRKIDECDMEKFGALDSSEKTIAILGHMVATDGETGRGQDKQKVPMQHMKEKTQ